MGRRTARPAPPGRIVAAVQAALAVPADPVLVRRGYVSAFETGPRPLPRPDALLRHGRPLLLPLSSLVCVATDRPVVALTYDDGPDPEHTPGVLDALAGTPSTFFVLAGRAERHPGLIRRMVADGHEVALHGIDHARLAAMPARRSTALIRQGRDRLEQVLGAPVGLYRPTYGAQRLGQLLGARRLGLEVVIWSAWARDWEGRPAPVIAERALGALHPGAILLLHDASGDGVGATGLDRSEATRRLLAGMAEREFTGRTVSQLVAEHPQVRSVWAERR